MTEANDVQPLPAPAPTLNPETRAFWEATAKAELLLNRCNSCGMVIWYPRHICPSCHSMDTASFQASGHGTIYSFAVTRRGQGAYREAVPYVLAYVELTEGPRVMTNIVDCDPERLAIGQPVRITFHDTGQGASLPRFRPEKSMEGVVTRDGKRAPKGAFSTGPVATGIRGRTTRDGNAAAL